MPSYAQFGTNCQAIFFVLIYNNLSIENIKKNDYNIHQ